MASLSYQAEARPSTRGRVLAGFYLLLLTCGILAQAAIADRLIVIDDPTRTAANITNARAVYQLAFTIFIVEMASQIVVTVMFYGLLRPVSRTVARLSAVFGLTGCGIKMFARVFFYAPLILLSGASYLSAFAPAQLAALSIVSVRLSNVGAGIALAFFGMDGLLRGWLIYRSGFMPRGLGVIAAVAGIGWMTYLWPPLGAKTFMIVAPFAIVGVLVTTGWLFIRGIDDKTWREDRR
jgi:hypothetical protein